MAMAFLNFCGPGPLVAETGADEIELLTVGADWSRFAESCGWEWDAPPGMLDILRDAERCFYAALLALGYSARHCVLFLLGHIEASSDALDNAFEDEGPVAHAIAVLPEHALAQLAPVVGERFGPHLEQRCADAITSVARDHAPALDELPELTDERRIDSDGVRAGVADGELVPDEERLVAKESKMADGAHLDAMEVSDGPTGCCAVTPATLPEHDARLATGIAATPLSQLLPIDFSAADDEPIEFAVSRTYEA